MSSPPPSAIFQSDLSVKAVITLVLIENSQEMKSVWGELRSHYLPTLLGTMRVANPVVPVRFFTYFLHFSFMRCPDTHSMANDLTSRE